MDCQSLRRPRRSHLGAVSDLHGGQRGASQGAEKMDGATDPVVRGRIAPQLGEMFGARLRDKCKKPPKFDGTGGRVVGQRLFYSNQCCRTLLKARGVAETIRP